jgi:hypothetical protein
MLPILLPILLIVGIVCITRPQFFANRPGLRPGLLLRLIPERLHTAVIRFLGVAALFASAVGLIRLIAIWT